MFGLVSLSAKVNIDEQNTVSTYVLCDCRNNQFASLVGTFSIALEHVSVSAALQQAMSEVIHRAQWAPVEVTVLSSFLLF